MSSAAEKTTLNIFEVNELAETGKLSIEARHIKDDKGIPVQRWFLNRASVRGPLMITLGDCTRGFEGDLSDKESVYEPTFLGRKPERHPDSPPDCTSKGALTIIPNATEGKAWIQFNRWIKGEILRVGAIRDKKNQVVTSMDKLESEFKDIIVEPEAGNDSRPNVCLWQKFQIGSQHADLNTKFQYVECYRNAKGAITVKRKAEFDPEILKAGTAIFSVLSIGELKKAPTGWGMAVYTRQVFINAPSESDGAETVVVFGGVKMVADEDEDNTAFTDVKKHPTLGETSTERPGHGSVAVFSESIATPALVEADVAVSEPVTLNVFSPVSIATPEVVPGIASDISDLAKTLAKFNDGERTETKRQRKA